MKMTLQDFLLGLIVIITFIGVLMLGDLIAPASDCAEYATYVRGDC